MNDLSFCKFSFPQGINKVIWEITNQCNYSCEYCIFSSTGKKPNGELSFEQIINALQDLKTNGFNYIKFTGGEPFMREDFIEILKFSQSIGFQFDISTNASFITEEISKVLSLMDINFIHVSLDGFDLESHESVRGKKSFNKTIVGLNHLLKYNHNIRIGCVIHNQNDSHLDKIVLLVNEFKVNELIFSMMSPIGRMEKNSPSLSKKTPTELIQIIESISSPFTKIKHNLHSDIQPINFKINTIECPGGSRFLFIDSIGIVSPCTWISEEFPQYHLLSLHHDSLNNILNSALFKNFNYEKSKLKGKCFAFSFKNKAVFNNIYSFATENISFIDSLPLTQEINKKALIVTGSGDQAISLTQYGFNDITCIDVNYLSNYFAELKVAAIKSLSFNDFIDFFKNNLKSFDYKIYKKFQKLLTPECEKFWNQKYIQFRHNGFNLRNSYLFNLKYDSWEQKLFNVPYLNSETIFMNLKESLKISSFKFITGDFVDTSIISSFDLILLSNIADYSHKIFKNDYIKAFKDSFVKKSLSLLNQDGILMFAYIYDFENITNSSIRNKINLPLIRHMYFKEYNYKETLISSAIQNLKHDVICYISKNGTSYE